MEGDERAFTTKGATTRDRIVAAAREMLLERGYDGLVLRELADSLDIKLGNLQYYFKTREGLALHVLGEEGARDARVIGELREQAGPVEAFRVIIRDMAMRYRDEPGRLLLMIATLAQHHEPFLRLYHDSYANFYPVFEDLLADMRPELTPDDIRARARVINALVEGSALQTEIGDLEAYLDRVQAEAEAIAMR